MDELFALQVDLYEQLSKAEKNFKKANKERLSKQAYLEARIETVDQLWKDFRSNHQKIVSTSTSEIRRTAEYFVQDLFDNFEEQYIGYKCTVGKVLRMVIEQKKQRHEGNPEKNGNSEVKLPKIQIPTFSGNYNEWQSFYGMFVSVVHNNKGLAEVEKLHYLKSSLKGEAYKVSANLPTTERNYQEAWKILKRRFANKIHNCNSVMSTLFSIKPIKEESASALKNLLDTTNSCLQSLANLEIDTTSWDIFIIYLVVSKLDKKWEDQLNDCLSEDNPTWSQLDDFLSARFRTLEAIQSKTTRSDHEQNKQAVKSKSFHTAVKNEKQNKTKEPECPRCDGNHLLYQCQKFNDESTQERQNFVQQSGLCFNCLHPSHSVKKCRIPPSCKKCGRKHHVLLHFERDSEGSIINNEKEKPEEPKVVVNFAKEELNTYSVLLATAIVRAHARDGRKCKIRALLDQGSQASFVSEATVQLLGLKRIPVNGVVSGLGDGHTRIRHMVTLKLESCNSKNIFEVNAYVLGSLTSILPNTHVQSPGWLVSEKLTLADPNFALPGKIDILLGAEIYSEILLSGILKSPTGNLLAQNTVLGWVVSGKMSKESPKIPACTSLHVQVRDNDLLKRFWELEAEPDSIKKQFTETEQVCESLFNATTTRNEEGRYVVELPFSSRDPQCQHGQSYEIARQRLSSLERRLMSKPKLYEDYRKVMDEYIELGYMALLSEDEKNNPRAVYLPHHAVVREDKDTTKVRIVFNASSKGTNGVSLNDDLLVGPKIQSDLRHLLMRWRTYPVWSRIW